jgi:streptomycin 6-kinase
MHRYINSARVCAAQLVTPADNPLLTENSRLMDVWFDGPAVRKQMFKKVTRVEQEAFREALLQRGFVESGNLMVNPAAILFAEMEHELTGGIVTIGFGDNNKPVELRVNAASFHALTGGDAP